MVNFIVNMDGFDRLNGVFAYINASFICDRSWAMRLNKSSFFGILSYDLFYTYEVIMKLGHTTIYVNDVVATVDFYQKAFGLSLQYLHDDNQYAQMLADDKVLAFHSDRSVEQNLGLDFRKNKREEKPAGFEISLATSDVPKAVEKAVKAGATVVLKPIQRPWGQTVSYVTDINGILVEICSLMEMPSSCE
jgi:lactoylglutathione lyase